MVIIMNKDVIQMIQTISKLIILVGIMKHKQGMNQFSIDTREWILKLTLMIQLQALMIQLIESKKTQPLIGFVNNKRKSTLLDKIVINITFILSMTKCHKINLFVTFINKECIDIINTCIDQPIQDENIPNVQLLQVVSIVIEDKLLSKSNDAFD